MGPNGHVLCLLQSSKITAHREVRSDWSPQWMVLGAMPDTWLAGLWSCIGNGPDVRTRVNQVTCTICQQRLPQKTARQN